MMRWSLQLVLFSVALALGACKQRQHLSRANIAVVERQFARAQAGQALPGVRDAGLLVKEVESVLGPPHRVDPPETTLRDVELFRYYYNQGLDTYELHFYNSKLIAINHATAAGSESIEAKP